MTSERPTTLNRRHTAFARVLSFVLLGFIVYGTTIEAAHKHGGQEFNSHARGTAVQSPGTANEIGSLAGCGECLICQLHQQFATSVLSARHLTSLPQMQREAFRSTFQNCGTSINALQTGRAPPGQLETA